MTQLNQIYKCAICGNVIKVVHTGVGELICCGQPMNLMEENSQDASQEKHMPVIEKSADGYLVKVGSVAHPMEEAHYIEWIELTVGEITYQKYLQPNQLPQAEFLVNSADKQIIARAYCNLHGLWKNQG